MKQLSNYSGQLEVHYDPSTIPWLSSGLGEYLVLGKGPLNAQGKASWALVGSPSKQHAWILANEPLTPRMEDRIIKLAESKGFDRSVLFKRN